MANLKEKLNAKMKERQAGQTIVLFAFLLIALIAFVGIAVDVGFVFVRATQLSKAIDAAALAAVTEVEIITELGPANLKTAQFLDGNLPLTAVYTTTISAPPIPDEVTFTSSARQSIIGALEYTVTGTWPVELYFLRVINFNSVNLQRSATAAYFPLTDILASRRVEDGALTTSNQAVFGPQICSGYGDPFSPQNPTWPGNNDLYDGLYSYRYRILIPGDYPEDTIRVELFDPDSINKPNNNGGAYQDSVTHTAVWNTQFPSKKTETLSCSANQKNPCLIRTQEDVLLGLPLDQVNPWWFVRIDENRGNTNNGPPGNGTCGEPTNYNREYNTITRYQLSYFTQLNDGTINEILLAQYSGQCNCSRDTDPTNHETDLRWVTPDNPVDPRSNLSIDQTVFVPTDTGIGTTESFIVDLTTDVPGIVTDPSTGDRYLYVDVRAMSGATENGFEIWAGPQNYVDDGIPSNVNFRNVRILDDPGSHSSLGVTVFGLGNLPLNSNVDNPVDIPLIYVPAEYAGQTITVSLFDPDSGADPPIVFFFDSIGFTPDDSSPIGYNPAQTDWAMSFQATNGTPDPDGLGPRNCTIGSCQDTWILPQFEITVPDFDADACAADPTNINVCTPFVGGRLVSRYQGGGSDTYGWEIRLPGLPFLVK
jgi:hypothetical protein